ncbi:MAG: glycine cleavage system protein GcvH [Candidatus Endonucleobacter bathymodioli]|uniref:Glycine cleavage system H protein n=1 Tax=Candidatus Endonucleibacter bathymodioli TaxID=539814 RepID=A0AA90STE1_9GAMM|nr:glycine cleavage system protein GcvH [Candidatus Endonucleobacter bathymodioli]
MSNIPLELLYFHSHEWVRVEDDDSVTIGLTEHAQEALGDVVFVELPNTKTTFAAGDHAGVVESVKAASDVYSPLSGEIIKVNEELVNAPETINSDPYHKGWFFKMKLSAPSELTDLMDAKSYEKYVEDSA